DPSSFGARATRDGRQGEEAGDQRSRCHRSPAPAPGSLSRHENYETQCSVVEPSRMPLPPMSGSQSAVDDSFKGSWEMVIEQSID
ncbi:unnamed protein product, partial [Musa hybrid cultivar]